MISVSRLLTSSLFDLLFVYLEVVHCPSIYWMHPYVHFVFIFIFCGFFPPMLKYDMLTIILINIFIKIDEVKKYI